MANNSKKQLETVEVLPCILIRYVPSRDLVPDEAERKEISQHNRFLVLDVKEAKHLVPGPISAAIKESAAIRMNRPYQPAIYGKDSGGRAKALKALKAFKVEAIATVPPQFRGKVRMLGEEEKLADDRKGQFILMSELYGADGKGGTVGKVEAAKQAATAAARAEIKAKLVAMGFDEKQIEEATAVSQVIAPTTDPRGGLIRRLWAWVRG